MDKTKYYSSGQFAQMAHISVRTVRYYDKENILKPSMVTQAGARYYTDEDFTRLQQIMLLKYLGFSLEDIRELTVDERDSSFLIHSLQLQQELIRDRIEQLQMVEQAIGETITQMDQKHKVDWSQMLDLIHLTNMESSLKSQYKNSNNISARIRLHNLFSTNKEGWFPWVYRCCGLKEGQRILELGCGNGTLWLENRNRVPEKVEIVLSDISEGMIRDVRRDESFDERFTFHSFGCENIPFEENSFDVIIANHVLFYCEDINRACKEISRVLKPGGRFICSTYGPNHMKEISELVQGFDHRIALAAENLYERFGLEEGEKLLEKYFHHIEKLRYEDHLEVTDKEPLIEYILSCHGNQNQYILDRYHKFQLYVEKKTKKSLRISKDAGVFVCEK